MGKKKLSRVTKKTSSSKNFFFSFSVSVCCILHSRAPLRMTAREESSVSNGVKNAFEEMKKLSQLQRNGASKGNQALNFFFNLSSDLKLLCNDPSLLT